MTLSDGLIDPQISFFKLPMVQLFPRVVFYSPIVFINPHSSSVGLSDGLVDPQSSLIGLSDGLADPQSSFVGLSSSL